MDSCTVFTIKNISVTLKDSLDIFSKNDPYVQITYGNTKQRTQTKINMDSASWDQPIFFPYIEFGTDTFTVKVYDEDKYTKDDLLMEEKITLDHDMGEKGVNIEQNGLKLFYGIGRFCMFKSLKDTFSRIDDIQCSVNRVYSSFKLL